VSKSSAIPQIIDAKTLLKIVGAIAFLLPFILILFSSFLNEKEIFRPSISDYVYSDVSVAFIGCLSAVSMYFFAYVGYDTSNEEKLNAKFLGKLSDQNIATIIAIFAAFVAIFPTTPLDPNDQDNIIAGVHFLSASLFLLLLAYMSIARFTKSSSQREALVGTMKGKRNIVYRIAGWVMVASVGIMAIYFIATTQATKDQFKYIILIGETICLFAFGIAWIVKGELVMKDKTN
jgi:hypothetical protein